MGIDSIEKSDLIIIDNIAKKYKLTLQELGKIISKNTEKRLRLQVLLSLEELYYLDKMAKLKGVSRGQYCYACCQEAINNNLLQNDKMNLVELIGKREEDCIERKEHRVMVTLNKVRDYAMIKRFSDEMGVPMSKVVRYILSNISI